MIVPFIGAAGDSLLQMSYDTSGVTVPAFTLADVINSAVPDLSNDVPCAAARMLSRMTLSKGALMLASCYVRIVQEQVSRPLQSCKHLQCMEERYGYLCKDS